MIQLAPPKDVPALLLAGLTQQGPVDEHTLDVCWHLHLRFFDRVSTWKGIAERVTRFKGIRPPSASMRAILG